MQLRSGRIIDIRSDPTPGGGWLSTYSDVTEARQAEEELRRAKESAEAANQAKSRFLATMSHELRTPLNAVIGFSDALLREATNPAPARVAEFARQINESGRNLLGLINIILDVARIEAGRFDLASDQVDVERLVRSGGAAGRCRSPGGRDHSDHRVHRAAAELRADERRLAQVLRHLLSNAVKFTEIGGTVTAGARMEPDGDAADFRPRHRDRHPGGRPGAGVRAVHPARFDAGAALPGVRPRALRVARPGGRAMAAG